MNDSAARTRSSASRVLTTRGMPASAAAHVASLPPVSVLFASLLGYNPIQMLLGPSILAGLSPAHAAFLTGRAFFPALISGPFADGLDVAFLFSIVACLVAAVASLLRGGKYVYREPEQAGSTAGAETPAPAEPGEPAMVDGHANGTSLPEELHHGSRPLAGASHNRYHLDGHDQVCGEPPVRDAG